jgi:parvulin-like peptidyl-prolyl isomerase
MRVKADSLLGVVRRGTSFDSVAAAFNGMRRNVIVTRNNFPGFWRGEDRDVDALFRTRPGEMMSSPVRGRRGWLLVKVQEQRPSYIAPLIEVARDIRAGLRREASLHHEERALHAMYAQVRDSLRGPAVRVRFAAMDTTRIVAPDPTVADLELFLKSHLADYSYFDNETGTVRARSLAEVGADVRQRWAREQRDEIARVSLDAIERAWRRNARDASTEKTVTLLRDVGPVPPGAMVDSSLAGFAVSDSLARRDGALGVGRGRYAEGVLVFQIYGRVENWTPTYEQAAPLLRARERARRADEEEKGARALFDADPKAFALGPVVYFSRLVVPTPSVIDVPLTREEVERYHREHLDRYSVPEEIRARHILVSPSGSGPAADSAARVRAESLLVRVRHGEDFATLASRFADDEATRVNGGDLGYFGRGAMLDAFEQAAFSMQPEEVSGLVKSEVGYHIIKIVDRLPAVAHPLETLWTAVGSEAALEKGEGIAARRADSLFRANPKAAQLKAAGRRAGLVVQQIKFDRDNRLGPSEIQTYLDKIAHLKPGEVYPGPFKVRGLGWTLSWLDSIGPARAPVWETAHDRALDQYRRGGGGRALDAKRAELDSLLARGWTLDSLGVLWGGLRVYMHAKGGSGFPVLNGGPTLDSLVIGMDGPPPLSPGGISDWVSLPGGIAKFRFVAMTPAEPAQVMARAENDRRAELDRKLLVFFDDLKRRWPVSILDSKLAQVPLPQLPNSP